MLDFGRNTSFFVTMCSTQQCHVFPWRKCRRFGILWIIFVSGLPTITSQNLCSRAQPYLGSDGIVQGIVGLENTIGYVGLDAVQKYRDSNQTKQRCKVKVASMVNKAGVAVEPSVPSAQAAVRSSAATILSGTACPGFGLCGNLLDASDEDVWPITALTYMLIPLVSADKDVGCGRMKAVQNYAIWILSNGEVGDIATSLQFAVMSLQTSQAALDIIQRMTCVDKNNVTHHISDIQDYAYDIESSGSTLQGDLQSSLTSEYFVQVFAGPVAIIFNVPALDSLVLTRRMVNDIFVGTLDTWNDPAIAAVNSNYSYSIAHSQFQPPDVAIIRVVRGWSTGRIAVTNVSMLPYANGASCFFKNCTEVGNASSSLPLWALLVLLCVGLTLLALSQIIFLLYLRRRVEPEAEVRLRCAINDLRSRLLITKKHGYYLSSEKLPWFRSNRAPIVIIPRPAVEAAAHMQLQETFDVTQFNAFCVHLEGHQTQEMVQLVQEDGELSTNPQYKALCRWILEISELLIKVDLERQPQDGGVAQLLCKRQFSFFANKVSKIQLWQRRENSAFKELQSTVQGLMSQVSPWCDKRYRKLLAEPAGENLVAYQWSQYFEETTVTRFLKENGKRDWLEDENAVSDEHPDARTMQPKYHSHNCSLTMRSRGNLRQDGDEVRAIRIDPEAQVEARLEIASACSSSSLQRGLVDEGVFITQLHRRATLLNAAFQQKMVEVMYRHADSHLAKFNLEGAGVLCPSDSASDHYHNTDLKSFICNFSAGPAVLQVHAAPIKKKARMREKLVEYASIGAAWPLTAHILDPVRMSIVVCGSAQILEVMGWFKEEDEAGRLKIVRVKNKFAFAAEDVLGGYRDMTISVLFDAPSGLRIIGEVQIQDQVMYDIKLKMHSLYKIIRASDPAKIF